VRTVGIRLVADVAQYTTGMRRADQATASFSGGLDKAAKEGKLDKVGDQAARFGLVGVAAFAGVVKSAADFDKQMSAVSAATHANTADMGALRQAALQAGKDTQYSATEAAKGITELSKAGVSTANILGGGLKGALSLAAAGQIDVGEAAETAASAMTQFKLSGSQVPHVADLLAAAAGKAQGSVHDMGMALNQTGLVAAQTGLSIEDTTGTLAAFASAGLIGSDAGTSFKTMLLAIQNPAGKTKDLMDDLGISAYDAQGNFVGIAKFAGILKDRLSGLTPQMRAQAMAQIFGNDAVRAANILYTQGQAGIDGWVNKVNDAGYASETASKLTDNLAGDLERLKGSVETLAIESGSGANGGMRALAQGLNALVDGFGQLPPLVGSSATVLAGLAGAGALGLAGFIKVRQGLAQAVEQMNAMGPAGEKAATGLQRSASAAGKAAAAFAALQIAGALISSFQTELNPQIDAAAKSLEEWARQCLLSGEAARLFGADSKDLDRALNGLANHGFAHASDAVTDWVLGIAGVSSPLDDAKTKVSALDQALAAMVKDGHAADAMAYLEARSKATGVSVDDLKKLLPAFSAALQTTGTAGDQAAAGAGNAAAATKKYTSAAAAATAATKGQRDALTDLADKMKAETDPVFGLLNAENNLAKAHREAAKATKEHGRNSVEAKDATRKLALAAIDLQSKAGSLGDTFNGKLSPSMRTTLKAAGLTERQIQDVAKQFRDAKKDGDKYAKNYQAKVTITGGKAAYDQLAGLSSLQSALKRGAPLPIQARRAFAFDTGGYTGPGAKYDVAGIVHADEFVIRKESRQKIEQRAPGLLDQMNKTGTVPVGEYADGGQVRMPFPVSARMTRIPSMKEALSVVALAGPSGTGPTDSFIIRAARALVGAIRVISTFRPGATTLSGNRSYHSMHRAVDFEDGSIGHTLAGRWNQRYKARTKELISPWNSLNIHNGQRHAYTGAIYRQHSGSNAHVHIAMAGGGIIREPVYGVGASGDTYSFAENGPERVTPMTGGGAAAGRLSSTSASTCPSARTPARSAGSSSTPSAHTSRAAAPCTCAGSRSCDPAEGVRRHGVHVPDRGQRVHRRASHPRPGRCRPAGRRRRVDRRHPVRAVVVGETRRREGRRPDPALRPVHRGDRVQRR
jgi:TP901 family phage tail tape measure protein